MDESSRCGVSSSAKKFVAVMIMAATSTLAALDDFDSARLRKYPAVPLEQWQQVTRREKYSAREGLGREREREW